MDSIDIIKPLSIVLSSAVNKSRQCRESNPEPLDAERERYPLCLSAPRPRARSIFTSSAFSTECVRNQFRYLFESVNPGGNKKVRSLPWSIDLKKDKTTRLNFFVPFWKYVARLCQPSFRRKWCGCKKMCSFDFFSVLFFEAVSSFLFSVETLRRKL